MRDILGMGLTMSCALACNSFWGRVVPDMKHALSSEACDDPEEHKEAMKAGCSWLNCCVRRFPLGVEGVKPKCGPRYRRATYYLLLVSKNALQTAFGLGLDKSVSRKTTKKLGHSSVKFLAPGLPEDQLSFPFLPLDQCSVE